MLRKTTNPTPTVTTAKVDPAAILRHVLVSAGAARTAALALCYSACAYILRVNHFTDANAKGYLSRQKAVDYLSEQIAEQTGVKGNMLGLYIRNASALAGALTGSAKMFSSTIQELGLATTPEAMVNILSSFVEKNSGSRIEALSDLSEALGFKVSKHKPTSTAINTPTKAVERVNNVMEAVEKAVNAGKVKGLKESTLAQAIVSHVKSPVIIAREAIKTIIEPSDLKGLERDIKDQQQHLKELSKRAGETVNADANKASKTPTKTATRGKSRPATRTQV